MKMAIIDTVLSEALPTEMTLGDVTYDILGFLKGDEKSVIGHTMVERVKEMKAHNGNSERDHLLAHQDEISPAFRGKVVFVFTEERHPGSPALVYYVGWGDDRWVERWRWLGREWNAYYRVLRRK